MSIRLEAVDPADLSTLRHLTFPAVVKIAQERYPSTARAVAVQTDDEAAGLAVSVPGADGQFELLSLYVAPFFRRLGFGASLLQAVEEDFRADGYRLGVHFLSVPADDQGNARFFMACGWSRPVPRRLICRSTVPLALETPWLVEARLPERYRIVEWQSLRPAQRAPLEAACGHWINNDVNPFLYEADCDPSTSAALVEADSGTVRGWVLTHRLDDRTLRWTCSFLQPDLQRLGIVRSLWLEVVRRQAQQPGLVDFTFATSLSEPRMARFALRRMRPWLSGLAYGCTTMKKVA
jgi:ribosomal protein S18 acetylase RimI-like enzyme